MTPRHLIGLGAVVAALVAAAVAVNLDRPSARQAADDPLLLPGLAQTADTAMEILVSQDGRELVVRRQGDDWILPGKHGYLADPARVRAALFAAARLEKLEPRTRKPAKFPGLGVAAPGEGSDAVLLEVRAEPGQPGEGVVIGKRGPDIDGGRPTVFARLPDADRVWLARGEFDLSSDPIDWLDADILIVAEQRIASIEIAPSEGPVVRVARAEPGAEYVLQDVPPGKTAVSAGRLGAIAYAVADVTLTDLRPAADWPDGPPRSRATVRTVDGLSVSIETAEIDGEPWIRLSAETFAPEGAETPAEDVVAEARQIAAAAQGWLYRAPQHKQSRFESRLADLLEDAQAEGD